MTTKQCKHCQASFDSIHSNKVFCSHPCQEEYWAVVRSKGGKSTKNARMKARLVRDTQRLSERQKQICLGGLLGDSSITPRDNGACRVRFGHGIDQKEYLEWKKRLMGDFIIQETPSMYISKGYAKEPTEAFIYETIVHEEFKRLYPLFYSSERKKRERSISWKTIEDIDAFGLLIWYLDDGCLAKPREKDKNGTVRLHTNAYPLPMQRIFVKWFWKKFRIEAKIQYNSTHGSHFLRFNTIESTQFLSLFYPFVAEVPECMNYKLLPILPNKSTLPADCPST